MGLTPPPDESARTRTGGRSCRKRSRPAAVTATGPTRTADFTPFNFATSVRASSGTQAAPAVTNCRAIVNGPGASNVVHTHPMCLLSGAYDVQAADGAGKLFFQDPRPVASFVTPHGPWTFQKVASPPVAGRFNVGLKWVG